MTETTPSIADGVENKAGRPGQTKSVPAVSAPTPGLPDLVSVVVAHHTRIDGVDRQPGDKVSVHADDAARLIRNGYVQRTGD